MWRIRMWLGDLAEKLGLFLLGLADQVDPVDVYKVPGPTPPEPDELTAAIGMYYRKVALDQDQIVFKNLLKGDFPPKRYEWRRAPRPDQPGPQDPLQDPGLRYDEGVDGKTYSSDPRYASYARINFVESVGYPVPGVLPVEDEKE